jgi:uncharacterized repeat protein (TIGR01451 family)/fimbrial isopeptide formation D2 family protein/LPXTG-motif cell wall-anchored protein
LNGRSVKSRRLRILIPELFWHCIERTISKISRKNEEDITTDRRKTMRRVCFNPICRKCTRRTTLKNLREFLLLQEEDSEHKSKMSKLRYLCKKGSMQCAEEEKMNKSWKKRALAVLMALALLNSPMNVEHEKESVASFAHAQAEMTEADSGSDGEGEQKIPEEIRPSKSEETAQNATVSDAEPTAKPTAEPTTKPTAEPMAEPTVKPTATPAAEPTAKPTAEPTEEPTVKPTATPTMEPTAEPTVKPTATPTMEPTAEPTIKPTTVATGTPNVAPATDSAADQTNETVWAPGYAKLMRNTTVYQHARGSRKIGTLKNGAILYTSERHEETRLLCAFLVRAADDRVELMQGWVAEKYLKPVNPEENEKMLRKLREQPDVLYFNSAQKLPLAFADFEAFNETESDTGTLSLTPNAVHEAGTPEIATQTIPAPVPTATAENHEAQETIQTDDSEAEEEAAVPTPTTAPTPEPEHIPTDTHSEAPGTPSIMLWASPMKQGVIGKLYAEPASGADIIAELERSTELMCLGELDTEGGKRWILLEYEGRQAYVPEEQTTEKLSASTTLGAARADSHAVRVSLRPSTNDPVKTGQTGTFKLQIGVNDPNENGTATVRVRIPDGVILPDFLSSNEIKQGELTVRLISKDGNRYIEVPDVSNGETNMINLNMKYPNGTTGYKELAFTDEDIIVDTAIEGAVLKETGSMRFIAAFHWVPVSKAVDKKTLTISADRKIEGGPVNYQINATSYNQNGSGDVYTKKYTLTDKLTLPEGLVFPEGQLTMETNPVSRLTTVSIRQNDGSTVVIADISAEDGQNGYGSPTVSYVSHTENSFAFCYTCEQPDGSYSQPLHNPSLNMRLYTENLVVGEGLLAGDAVAIDNHVDFEAIPCVKPYNTATLDPSTHTLQISPTATSSANHSSSYDASTAIEVPAPGYEVQKRLAEGSPTVDPLTGIVTLRYDLSVRNTGATELNMRITDTLPEGLVFAEGQAYYGFVGTTQYTGTENGKTVEWSDVVIPHQGTFTAQITAQTTEETPEGELINTLSAVDAKEQNGKNTTHTYTYTLPEHAIGVVKTHQTHSGADNDTLVRGGKITYTVEVENTGALQTTLDSVTDSCPDALEIDADSVTMNGEALTAAQVTIAPTADGRQLIRFPVPEQPLAVGEKVVYTYTATLRDDAAIAAGTALDNIATATSGAARAMDTDTVTLREPTTNLKAEKEIGEIQFINGRYAIEYRLRIINHGDAMAEDESIQLTDKMEGELYPGEGFSVTLIRADGVQETIVPQVKPVSDAMDETDYEIQWELSNMPGYDGTQDPPETVWTYSYTAYANVREGENLHVKNLLLVGNQTTGGVGPGDITLAPEPGVVKTITGVTCANGGSSHRVSGKEENKAVQIHGGDVVAYRMVFTNTGNVDMVNTILSDVLPAGFINEGTVYAWKMAENQPDLPEGRIERVAIETQGFPEGARLEYALKDTGSTGTVLVISATEADAASGSPQGFDFPAGAEVTLTLTLRYPGGETYNRHFLRYDAASGDYTAPGAVPNRANMKGADRAGQVYDLNDQAEVYPQPNIAGITKLASATKVSPGEEVTFTFKGKNGGAFISEGMVTDAMLVEDLTPFKDAFELVGYKIGRIDSFIPGADQRGSYTFKLLNQPAITQPYYTEAREVRLETPIDLSQLTGDDLKIIWNLGDVRRLGTASNGGLDNNWPTITLRAKEGATSQSITNTVSIQYDGTRYNQATADVTYISGNRLTKSAVRDSADGTVSGGSIHNGNAGEQLQVGDTVTFTLEYVNTTAEAESYSDDQPLVLHDIMPTNGLAVYDSAVEFAYIPLDAAVGGSARLIGPNRMDITQADIDSANAKRTDFRIAGTLQPGDVLQIRYKVKVGEGYRDSAADNAMGRKDSYASGLTRPDSASGNLHQVHNYVYTTGTDGFVYSAETDYYYTSEGNRLYFSKAVKNIGHLEVTTNPNGSNHLVARTEGYVAPGKGSLTQFGGPEQNFVKYTVVIYNDANSNENLVVNSITDRLPPNVLPLTDDIGGKHYVMMRSMNSGTGFFKDSITTTINTMPWHLTTSYTLFSIINDILLPTPERNKLNWHPNMRIEVAAQSVSSVEFKLFNAGSGSQPLTLKPGEYVTFCYAVYLDRAADFSAYANNATLNTQPCADGSGWEALDSSYQKVFITKQKSDDVGSTAFNVDTGKRINEAGTRFGATVSIGIPAYRMSMTKSESSYYPTAGKEELTEEYMESFLKNRAGADGESSSDWSKYGLYDIVEWKITVTNRSNVPIDDFMGKDFVPYPHRAVYYTDATGRVCFGRNGDRTPLYGQITDFDLTPGMSSFGATSYQLDSEPFRLEAGESRTFYVYTVYDPDPSTPISYASVVNRAQVTTAGGKVFSNISDANPMLDEAGRIIGATQSAAVTTATSASVASHKTVTFEGQTASGNGAERTVTADKRGDTVRYTLYIDNKDPQHDMRDVTLIDSLPVPGDYGVINLSAPRRSEFTVNLAEQPNITVEVKEKTAQEWTRLSRNTVFDLTQVREDQYLVLFTPHVRHEGSNPVDIWNFETPEAKEHWFTSANGRTTSVLFYVPKALKANYEMRISFDCVIQDDAQLNQIAWNSFGYGYRPVTANTELTGNEPQIFAEPAKVGVKIDTYYAPPELPSTGGTGTEPYALAGLALILLAAGSLTQRRRKRR